MTEMNRKQLIEELEKALERMEKRGSKGNIHYKRLKAKKEAVEEGKEYKIVDRTKELIGEVGALIPNANKFFN